MVLPPEDYCDAPQRSIIKNNMPSTTHITTNSNHQHSPTPSAASSLSSEHNTVSQQPAIFVHLCGILLFHLEGVPGGQCVSMHVRPKSLPFLKDMIVLRALICPSLTAPDMLMKAQVTFCNPHNSC